MRSRGSLVAKPPWAAEQELVERAEEGIDEAYGCRPSDRTLDQLLEYGVVALDKPSGPTSHDVTASVKRLLKAKRAGHSGTLELATARRPRCDRLAPYSPQPSHQGS